MQHPEEIEQFHLEVASWQNSLDEIENCSDASIIHGEAKRAFMMMVGPVRVDVGTIGTAVDLTCSSSTNHRRKIYQ